MKGENKMYQAPEIELIVITHDDIFTAGSNSTPDDEL